MVFFGLWFCLVLWCGAARLLGAVVWLGVMLLSCGVVCFFFWYVLLVLMCCLGVLFWCALVWCFDVMFQFGVAV